MQKSYPFDASSEGVREAEWTEMAQHWLPTGVISSMLNELQVYADSTGMQVKVKTGMAWLKGHYFISDAEEVMAISTADATNPRIDRIIVKLDWNANAITLTKLQGTPAASPVAPALTQNTSRWEISLAQVRVNAGVTTIAATNITNERTFANKHTDLDLTVSVAQTISALTDTKFNFNNVIKDNLLEWDAAAKKITIRETGSYALSAHASWGDGNGQVGKETQILLYVNGSKWIVPICTLCAESIADTDMVNTVIRSFNVGDVVEVYFWHSYSGSISVNPVRFEMVKFA